MIDPAQFKSDPRSAQELAKAILDHDLIPASDSTPRQSFREQLWMDMGTRYEKPWGNQLLFTLKMLEDGQEMDRKMLHYGLARHCS